MDHLAGKRILITGANGFVGAHLACRLAGLGADVHAAVRPGADLSRLSALVPEIAIHEADLAEAASAAALVAEVVPAGVFHLAAASQSYGRIPSPDELIEVNVKGTIRLMDLVPPDSFFVNTDSFAEVGAKDHPLREDDRLEPTELYGISRIPATLYAATLGKKGRPVATARLFTPYGPFVQKGKLPYQVITHALCGDDIELSGPDITRDLVYIDDAIEAYLRISAAAFTHPGEVFNVGAGRAVSLRKFADIVLKEADSKSVVRWNGEAATYDRSRWEADMSKSKELLGFAPATSLEEGVRRTIAWFRDNRHYWRS